MSPWLSDLFLASQSDERLVSLARAGHPGAFAAIVKRYRSELHVAARRLAGDGRSEDVVQQALLGAFKALSGGAEVRHLRGWLHQIVRNVAVRSRGPVDVPLDEMTLATASLEDVAQQRALALSTLEELGRLPERQRTALVGTALNGLARAQLADELGVSEGAVRQLVHRARVGLRSAVTAVTPWPLARWFAAVGAPPELAAGAGALSGGALATKLGAVLGSSVLLAGVGLGASTPHRRTGRQAAPAPSASVAAPGAGATAGARAMFVATTPQQRPRAGAGPVRAHRTTEHRALHGASGDSIASSSGSFASRPADSDHVVAVPADRHRGSGRDASGHDGSATSASDDGRRQSSSGGRDDGSRTATATSDRSGRGGSSGESSGDGEHSGAGATSAVTGADGQGATSTESSGGDGGSHEVSDRGAADHGASGGSSDGPGSQDLPSMDGGGGQ